MRTQYISNLKWRHISWRSLSGNSSSIYFLLIFSWKFHFSEHLLKKLKFSFYFQNEVTQKLYSSDFILFSNARLVLQTYNHRYLGYQLFHIMIKKSFSFCSWEQYHNLDYKNAFVVEEEMYCLHQCMSVIGYTVSTYIRVCLYAILP